MQLFRWSELSQFLTFLESSYKESLDMECSFISFLTPSNEYAILY